MVCRSCPRGSDAFADLVWVATLGARMCSAGLSRSIGFMVHAGGDFPPSIEATLSDWRIRLVVKKDAATGSTRGLLQYQDSSFDGMSFAFFRNFMLTPLQQGHSATPPLC